MFKKYEYIVKIDGMKCNNCANHVINGLSKIDGVKKVEVNLEEKEAHITSSKEIDKDVVKDIIDELEYRFIDINLV